MNILYNHIIMLMCAFFPKQKNTMENNKIYVFIGKEIEERKSVLKWALNKFIGNTICVIYIHVPAKRIALPSGLVLQERFIRKVELQAFRAQEREAALQLLDDCSKMCALFQAPCVMKMVEKVSITEGILDLIHEMRIEKLVMGAAANNKYWRGMTILMSEKAKFVRQFAPDFCHVWFVCNDHMISQSRQREVLLLETPIVKEVPSDSSETLRPQLSLDTSKRSEPVSRRRPANPNRSSTFSASESSSTKSRVPQSYDGDLGSSSPSNKSNVNGNLSNQLEQAISKSESSWRDACREPVSSSTAKKQNMEAIRTVKPVERPCYEELIRKKAKEEEAENMKQTFSKVSLQLSETLDQKLSLESQNEQINLKVKMLEENMFAEMEMSQKYKEERDKMQIERNSALKEAQALSELLGQRPSSSVDLMFSEFSPLELQWATEAYNESLKIGEGSYGRMYKGFLHHTQVAIKLLHPNIVQNQLEFDEQVGSISKLRHPNIVTLMGACREPLALVYEYLPNGNLDDALIRQNFSTPLPWQMRVRIAMDICSALIFLHSSRPACIAQGDLTPRKLLLDANFTCKITDFGIVSKDSTPSNLFITRAFKPEPHNRKAANLESDVYSFGIIMLQLLTGKQATLGLVTEVKYASKTGTLDTILDPFAGEWPFVQAEQLAHMALRCCDINNEHPDLAGDVWRVLAPMRASCSGSSLLPMASDDQPPHYFTCPILQETMEDPHFAADGFTYEAEAIQGWFDSGHDTSPMTNVRLSNLNLIPNRALRSVIQEWLQSTSTK